MAQHTAVAIGKHCRSQCRFWSNIYHVLFLILGLLPGVAIAQTIRAYDFYSKFGVNTGHRSGETIFSILRDTAYIGILNIRDSIYSESDATALAQLAAAGIKLHMDYQAWKEAGPAMSSWLGWLKTHFVVPYPGSIVGVSGPNEVDVSGNNFVYGEKSGVVAANLAQQDLYNGVKGDPVLAGIPVDMWPLGFAYKTTSTNAVGNMTAYCDRVNMHDYYLPDNHTSLTGTNGVIQVQIPAFLKYYRLVCNRLPWITSETGWQTPYAGDNMYSLEVSEDVQAKLLLVDLFDHAILPDCKAVYIYMLAGGSADTSAPYFGLFHNDRTPKVSANVIRNLTTILRDSGPTAATFTTMPMNYALSGMPAASGNFIIQKSSGSHDILLWNETTIWDMSTGQQIAIPDSMVTVDLPSGSSGSIYNPLTGTDPVSTFSDVNRVVITLNDTPLIIEVQ
jgi:hypothetical protein